MRNLKGAASLTVAVVSVVVMFSMTLLASVLMTIFAPDSAAQTTTLLVGLLAPTIASISVLVKVNTLDSKVDDVNTQLNGQMDKKIQTNLHAVMDERFPEQKQ